MYHNKCHRAIRSFFVGILLVSVAFLPNFSLAQEKTDSISILLRKSKPDIQKVRLLKELSVEYYKAGEKDSAVYIGKQGLALATIIGDEQGIAEAHGNLGIFYYQGKELFDSAVFHLFKSLEIKRKLNDLEGIAKTNNSLGGIYDKLEDPEKSFPYYSNAAIYFKSVHDIVNLATAQMNVGNTYLRRELYDSAMHYYYLAKPVYESYKPESVGLIYINIGESYENLGLNDSAHYYYYRAYDSIMTAPSNDEYAAISFYVGRFWLNQNNLDSAYLFLTNSYLIAKNEGLVTRLIEVSEVLIDYFIARSNPDSALYYSLEYIEFSTELAANELDRSLGVAETEYMYKAALSEQEKLALRERKIRYLLYIASFLGLMLTIYIFRSYLNKQKANKLLAEMDAMKTRMYTNISHELRTPLTLILGPLEEMMEEEAKKRPTQKTVAMMRRNASRLLGLVNQMLDLSKIDAGALKLELIQEDIVKDLKHLVLSFTTQAEKKQISYSHEISHISHTTWFDPDKLEKVVVNLLSNAFKYTPEGGSVSVRLKIEADNGKETLRIEVKDTGPGIPPGEQEKIFERFHQVEDQATMEQVGTGIGLALTRELVELMHGSIQVVCEVGEGSTFVAVFSLGKEHLRESEYAIKESGVDRVKESTAAVGPEEIVHSPEEIDAQSEVPILLIVEDHADIRNHVRERMEDNYQVIEAADGKEGLEKALEHVPDIIITDLMMPEMDGVEMTAKLKTDERTSHIPIIMLTAKASVEDRIEGLETGADDYLTKPFHMKELKVRLQNLVEQRKKLRDKYRKEIILEPKEIAVNSADERFLEKTMAVIEENLSDPDLDVARCRDAVGMSRMQYFRKVKALTDQSPNEFIRSFRLKRAAQLLEKGFGNVAEVTYEVGFNNLSYFAKCFKEMFGKTPSEYIKETQG